MRYKAEQPLYPFASNCLAYSNIISRREAAPGCPRKRLRSAPWYRIYISAACLLNSRPPCLKSSSCSENAPVFPRPFLVHLGLFLKGRKVAFSVAASDFSQLCPRTCRREPSKHGNQGTSCMGLSITFKETEEGLSRGFQICLSPFVLPRMPRSQEPRQTLPPFLQGAH